MNKDWLPFFAMLFWFATKLAGLGLLLAAFWALVAMLNAGFGFWAFATLVLLPSGVGVFLLASDAVADIACAEQRRRVSGP